MDINLMRRVKKERLTEQAESQIDWFRVREVPLIIRKKKKNTILTVDLDE